MNPQSRNEAILKEQSEILKDISNAISQAKNETGKIKAGEVIIAIYNVIITITLAFGFIGTSSQANTLDQYCNDIYDRMTKIQSDIRTISDSKQTVYIISNAEREVLESGIPTEIVFSEPKLLPDGDTNTFRCMDYRTITDHNSMQWKLQLECLTDEETGIRYYLSGNKKYYCAALGSAYGQTLGDAFHVTLENGYEFDIIYAEFKNPLQDEPDPTFYGHPDVNYDGEQTTSIIEFVYDWTAAPQCVIDAGTMSALEQFGGLYGNGGNIIDISYTGRIWGV